ARLQRLLEGHHRHQAGRQHRQGSSRLEAATHARGRSRAQTQPDGNRRSRSGVHHRRPPPPPTPPPAKAALKHTLTATVDPEAVCIIGGIPRHNASGLPFEVLHGAKKIAFLYWYSYFRLIPIDAALKHSDDP